MSKEILDLRRQARAEKAARDLETLEFHRAVVELLYAGGQVNQDIKRKALEVVQLWEDRQTCSPRYSHTWREWLNLPPEYARRVILDETDLGLSMRCNSPFGFLKGKAAAYDEWLRAKVQAALDDPRPSIPHDQVMAEIRALIERKRCPGGSDYA